MTNQNSMRRPYRPKDPNERAHLLIRIATGQEPERYEDEEPRPWWLAWVPRLLKRLHRA